MGKKLPRFEDGKPLSASKLNQIAETDEVECLPRIVIPETIRTASPDEQIDHWQAEAKKAFAERDALKAKLREAAPSVAAEDWRKQFFKDIDPSTEAFPTHCPIDFFLFHLEAAEKEGKTITRIDAPAELLKIIRKLGATMNLVDASGRTGYTDSGFVGTLNLPTPIDIYLNNSLGGKVRLYLEKVGYREYDYPVNPKDEPKKCCRPGEEVIPIPTSGQAKILLVWTDGLECGNFVCVNGHPMDVSEQDAEDILADRMPRTWSESRRDMWEVYRGKVKPVLWDSGQFLVSDFSPTICPIVKSSEIDDRLSPFFRHVAEIAEKARNEAAKTESNSPQVPLIVVINHLPYQVCKNAMTGAELRGIPKPSISSSYDLFMVSTIKEKSDHLVPENGIVAISPGMEFYSAFNPKSIKVRINHNQYWADKPTMYGREIRKLSFPSIGSDQDLWLESSTGIQQDDMRIADDTILAMKEGMSFYSAPSLINGG